MVFPLYTNGADEQTKGTDKQTARTYGTDARTHRQKEQINRQKGQTEGRAYRRNRPTKGTDVRTGRLDGQTGRWTAGTDRQTRRIDRQTDGRVLRNAPRGLNQNNCKLCRGTTTPELRLQTIRARIWCCVSMPKCPSLSPDARGWPACLEGNSIEGTTQVSRLV